MFAATVRPRSATERPAAVAMRAFPALLTRMSLRGHAASASAASPTQPPADAMFA